MKRLLILAAVAVALAGTSVSGALAQNKGVVAFGALEAANTEKVQTQARDWLKQTGKANNDMLQQFETLWQQNERSTLDRLADTFALADPQVARLLEDARDPLNPSPTEIPDMLKNDKDSFFQSNLSLAYAKNLVHRRVYEEALEILNQVKAEDVIDPAAYLFQRAVCEHGMLKKTEANSSISRLLEDVLASPDRYKTVSILMLLDMQTWKDKDLGDIARKMENIERRLELAKGGPQTQKLQKEVINRLDELIKKLENEAKQQQQQQGGGGKPNGGSCPDGSAPGNGPPAGGTPNKPLETSQIAGTSGSGNVDAARLRDLGNRWGEMTERERAEAMQELTTGLSQVNRQVIENYFRNIAKGNEK
jgi:tetratricopeptide (TPR) repeat protein